jgi:hypothetical protein
LPHLFWDDHFLIWLTLNVLEPEASALPHPFFWAERFRVLLTLNVFNPNAPAGTSHPLFSPDRFLVLLTLKEPRLAGDALAPHPLFWSPLCRFLLTVNDPAGAAAPLSHSIFREARLRFWLTLNRLALTAIDLLLLVVLFDVFVSQRTKAFFFLPLDSNKILTTTRIKITSTQGIEPVAQRADIPSAMMLSLQTIHL